MTTGTPKTDTTNANSASMGVLSDTMKIQARPRPHAYHAPLERSHLKTHRSVLNAPPVTRNRNLRKAHVNPALWAFSLAGRGTACVIHALWVSTKTCREAQRVTSVKRVSMQQSTGPQHAQHVNWESTRREVQRPAVNAQLGVSGPSTRTDAGLVSRVPTCPRPTAPSWCNPVTWWAPHQKQMPCVTP